MSSHYDWFWYIPLPEDVISVGCLMGNLFRDFKPPFEAVATFAKVPESLSHGKPLESESNRGLPIPADPASRVL